MRRTRRRAKNRRKQTRRRKQRGGDYRQFTSETVGGTPVTYDATVMVSGKGLMTLKEFRALKDVA